MKIILTAIFLSALIVLFQFKIVRAEDDPAPIAATSAVNPNAVSCPIPGGTITEHSYQSDPANGHCSGSYGFSCHCGTEGRRAKAIDIGGQGVDVVLPTVGGKRLEWELITKDYHVEAGEGGGVGNTFRAVDGNDKWYVDMLHLEPTQIKLGEKKPSGTVVSKTAANHAHVTVGKNISGNVAAGSDSDCDPGWLASDFMCDGSSPQIGSVTGSVGGGAGKSNKVCVKVGNPTEPDPCLTGAAVPGQAGNFTYYCQGNPEWDDKSGSCSIGQNGCGPTSMAMIFSYFGDVMTPGSMNKTYFDNNLISCKSGSFPDNVNSWVKKQPGYEVGPNIGSGTLNAVEAKKYIDEGWLILGSSDEFIGQSGHPIGHIFVVQDVDPTAKTFVLRDPENCSYSTGQEFTQNINQPILGGKVPSWKYAYPIRKKTT